MTNLINTTGYLNNSPNRFNKKNIIPSNIITMDNVNIPLLLRPNKGKPVIAMPNSGEYKFPKAKFVTEIPIGQMGGYAQNLLNDCPEGFVKDNSGNCIPDTGFNPGQYQNKGMPILPINNINNQSVGGTGALNKILNSPQSDENVSEYETKMKRKFGTPNIPAILGTNLLGFGLATVANNIEQGRQKSFMMNQMNNPLFNGSYSFAQNDYGTDPYEQTGQLRQYQQGGRTPIYTNNPNDPRLRAYNDSLTLYNSNNNKKVPDFYGAYKRLTDKNKVLPHPDFIKERMFYRKPVQQVVYQKPEPQEPEPQEPKFKAPNKMQSSVNPLKGLQFSPNISDPNLQRAEWDNTKKTKWSFTYPTGEYNGQKTVYFPDKSTWKDFLKNQKTTDTQETSDYGSATGYMQMGGKFDPIAYLYGDDEDKKEEIQEKKEVKKRKIPRITDENVDELSLLGLSIDDFLFSGKLPANFSANSVNKSGSSKGFRTFSSYEEGKQALHNQLNLYKTGKTKVGLKPSSTLLEAMSKYAPFGDGANNPIVYSNVIAKKLGITPNTPISQIDTKKWADAIEKVEGNKKGNNPGNIRYQLGGSIAPTPFNQEFLNTIKSSINSNPSVPKLPYDGYKDPYDYLVYSHLPKFFPTTKSLVNRWTRTKGKIKEQFEEMPESKEGWTIAKETIEETKTNPNLERMSRYFFEQENLKKKQKMLGIYEQGGEFLVGFETMMDLKKKGIKFKIIE